MDLDTLVDDSYLLFKTVSRNKRDFPIVPLVDMTIETLTSEILQSAPNDLKTDINQSDMKSILQIYFITSQVPNFASVLLYD